MTKDMIEPKGLICSIDGNRIKVDFFTLSACSNCYAKSVCTSANMENKEMEVVDNPGKFQEGEKVKVLLRQGLGFQTLFFSYVLPFLIILIALFTFK